MLDRGEIRGAVTALALLTGLLLVGVTVDFRIPGQALLQSLRFHIAGLMALAVVVLLLMGGWRRATIFGLVLFVSVLEGGYFVFKMQMHRAEAAEAPHHHFLNLLSFNILALNTKNGAAIADFIKGSGADIVVIMEAEPLFPYLRSLAGTYVDRVGCDTSRVCDLMVLSRTPLERATKHDLGPYWRDRLITAQTVIDGQRLNVVAAHMAKPYFDGAAITEARSLRRILNNLSGPLLLAGDFNAAPWSDNIERLIRTSKLMTAPYYPATWPVELGAFGVPIDNVFVRDSLIIDEITAIEDAMGSNHRGLTAKISITTAQ